jgi:hypothetical protein
LKINVFKGFLLPVKKSLNFRLCGFRFRNLANFRGSSSFSVAHEMPDSQWQLSRSKSSRRKHNDYTAIH